MTRRRTRTRTPLFTTLLWARRERSPTTGAVRSAGFARSIETLAMLAVFAERIWDPACVVQRRSRHDTEPQPRSPHTFPNRRDLGSERTT